MLQAVLILRKITMELKDFDFNLPEGLIAQFPLKERDSSRLMVLSRSTGELLHRGFRDIKECLRPGDILVLNDTKVLPARLIGKKASGGHVELLLVRRLDEGKGAEVWTCLIKNSKGLRPGSRLSFSAIGAEILEVFGEGLWRCSFDGDPLAKGVGRVPLPPYIRREPAEEDKARYQTVFAGPGGAVAAPTAGLHFTDRLIEEIKAKGVEVVYITLHTGPGTFMPIRVKSLKDHKMHGEYYTIAPKVFEAIRKGKDEGRRIIAVGTTSTRALEASAGKGFENPVLEGSTGLFIYPGFEFKVIDGLLTNFHLPCSTLIMLAAAFAGRERLLAAYEEAVKEGYRFFSYGDAMFIA